MIVVLDTNVLVSALQFSRSQGIPARAVTKAMTVDVIAFADEMRSETTARWTRFWTSECL
jgi:predicted nucleic acid-binding protein